MSVGADSLMGHLNMNKLLDKETLEKGRIRNITNKSTDDKQIDEIEETWWWAIK